MLLSVFLLTRMPLLERVWLKIVPGEYAESSDEHVPIERYVSDELRENAKVARFSVCFASFARRRVSPLVFAPRSPIRDKHTRSARAGLVDRRSSVFVDEDAAAEPVPATLNQQRSLIRKLCDYASRAVLSPSLSRCRANRLCMNRKFWQVDFASANREFIVLASRKSQVVSRKRRGTRGKENEERIRTRESEFVTWRYFGNQREERERESRVRFQSEIRGELRYVRGSWRC